MSADTHLKRRGATYHFRLRIPAELVESFGKAEASYSLKTKDLATAKVRAREQYLIWQQRFNTERAKLKALQGPVETITEDRAREVGEALAAEWVRDVLQEDEDDRVDGLGDVVFEEQTANYAAVQAALKDALARGNPQLVNVSIDEALEQRRLAVAKESRAYKLVVREFLQAAVRLSEMVNARQRGEIVPTPAAPEERPAAEAGSGITLAAVSDRWASEAKPRSRTVADCNRAVRALTEITGEVPIEQIERAHVVAFKDSLLGKGLAQNTAWKQITFIGTLFRYARRNGLVSGNVAEGIISKKGGRSSRKPFTVEDLNAIFASSVYSANERPRGGGKEAAHWIPLLALFTGARREELAQLLTNDVKRTPDGIVYLDVTEYDEEGEPIKQLKTDSSRRRVPIHPELIRLGFLAYVEDMRSARERRLFPALKPDKDGRLGENWGKWFSRYLRGTIGITDSGKVFHSFRHTWKRQARECEIPKALNDAITGHESGDVGDSYGGEYPLRPLAEAMGKLEFPGLELSVVAPYPN